MLQVVEAGQRNDRRLERLETRDEFIFEEVDAAIAIRGETATYATLPVGPRALPPLGIAQQLESLSSDNPANARRASA